MALCVYCVFLNEEYSMSIAHVGWPQSKLISIVLTAVLTLNTLILSNIRVGKVIYFPSLVYLSEAGCNYKLVEILARD